MAKVDIESLKPTEKFKILLTFTQLNKYIENCSVHGCSAVMHRFYVFGL